MLKERGVAPFSKWEKELPKIVFDPRFKVFCHQYFPLFYLGIRVLLHLELIQIDLVVLLVHELCTSAMGNVVQLCLNMFFCSVWIDISIL
jgi:hypothetical protein